MVGESFYRALATKDRRFDGRVFFGVTSTGIYCRPICPARTPLRKNVKCFATAAAAEDAGFRPCLRCRPETSPGTPAWLGTSATVSRALRLIAHGALDLGAAPELAGKLGVTERHLRRLFVEHLGAPPQAIASLRRLDFARQLVDQTGLPLTEIAFLSGFESVRRFNDAFKKRFLRSPSEIRRRLGTGSAEERSLRLSLPYRPPYAWPDMMKFLETHLVPGVEAVEDGAFRRTFRCEGKPAWLSVRPNPPAVRVEVSLTGAVGAGLIDVIRRVRQVFDLEADPLTLSLHLKQDERLAPLVAATPGLRVPGAWDGFETAVRTLVGQQVSLAGARTILKRMVERYGVPTDAGGGLTHLFPTAKALSRLEPEGLGMPGARAKAIRTLARAFDSGRLRLSADCDPKEERRKLLEIPGIGPWSAQYIAMRALRDTDAFPDTDLILARTLGESGNPELWRPWRAYAAHYLWKSGTQKGKRK